MRSALTLETKWFSEHEIKIVRGTYDAMARIGTQQLSLRRIAKELDVSPALLAYHFGTRDALLIATLHWALAGTVRRIKRHIDGIADPLAALSALMDAVFVDPQKNRDFHLVYMDLVQYSVRRESYQQLADLLREHIDGSYAAVIRQGADAGAFQVDDADLAARRARSLVEGGFLQWLQDNDWHRTHRLLRDDCHQSLLLLLSARSAKGCRTPMPAKKQA
jgi:AcrR family transcriptional regulator